MNAHELMIGNYVYNLNKIYALDSQDIYLIDSDSSIAKRFKPIPITEKWLLDFGFYLENSKDRLTIEAWSPGHPSQRFNIDWKDEKILLISRYQEDHDFLQMRNIKYIHQLQNLFFSLTNQQLKLK